MEKKKERQFFQAVSDLGFKKLFATEGNEALRLQLLNAVIQDREIVEAKLLETTHAVNEETSSTFDLYCLCSDGERVIVEMQKRSRGRFMDRALAYSAMAILDQARRKWGYEFGKIYFVGILDYVHFHGRNQALTRVSLQTEDDHQVTNENYLQIFVELPKLATKGKATGGEGFLRAVRDIGKSDSRPAEYLGKEYDNLFHAAMYGRLDDEEKQQYETEMSTEEDYREWHEYEVKKSREEGREEGLRDTARNMLAEGLDAGLVSKCTGLSPEEIAALQAVNGTLR